MTAILQGAFAFCAALFGLYAGVFPIQIGGVDAGYWEIAAVLMLTGLLLSWKEWARLYVWLPSLTGFALGLAFRQIILSEQGIGLHPQTSLLIPAFAWIGYEVRRAIEIQLLGNGNKALP
jgi:hypothetical protein